MYEILERMFAVVVDYGILIFETIGVAILLVSAIRALISLFKSERHTRLMLAEGISIALSFLLGSEVLKTIEAPGWSEIGMTCAILLMRAGMVVLIHWESKHEHP